MSFANRLLEAIKVGRIDEAKHLLSSADNVDAEALLPSLQEATVKGNMELFDLIVRAGANVNAFSKIANVLMYASMGGSVDIVKLLMSAGADVNDATQEGSALMVAAAMGHSAVVEVLIGAGASLNAVDGNDRTALMYATMGGHLGIVKVLLNAGAEVNSASKLGQTALLLAAEKGDVGIVEVLIGAGASVSVVDYYKQSSLMHASNFGSVTIVKLLLSAGADPNDVHEVGKTKTALMLACRKGHVEVVEALLGAGASLTAIDENGWTALMCASMNGSVAIVKVLLTAGSEIEAVPKRGKQTALLFAVEEGHLGVAEVLIGAGARLNVVDWQGLSALMYASMKGHVDMVKLFLSAGADTNIKSHEGKTALMCSCEEEHVGVVEVLVGAGVDLAAVDKYDCTALMCASRKGNVAIVKILLSAGADVSAESKREKKTALLYAAAVHVDVVKVLIEAGASAYAEGVLTLAPIFTVKQYRRGKEIVCTSDVLTLNVLQNNHNDMWCLLVQVNDISGVEDLIRGVIEKHPELVDAKDVKGRAAVDMATPVIRQTINSVRLWFGKYSPVSGKPEHTSATCFVVKAMDESGEGEPVPVALKLMRVRAQFERETAMRKYGFDRDCVMGASEVYPARELTAASDPDVVDVDSSEMTNGVLTKAVAERLYCVVMPFADRNMFVAMKQERFAGKEDMSEVVTIFTQLVKCVMHMHGKGVLHGDIKPMNLVRMGAKWMLIDLDACCVLGRDCVGFKSSSAYIPPEAVFCDAVGGVVKVKSESVCREYGVAPLVAHESFDVWSLGCILYQLCSDGVLPLFAANQDDNLNSNVNDAENSLWSLCEWSDKLKASKLSRVLNQQAKNLLSLMLSKDPFKRPTLSRVLSHPFLSGKSYGRVAGEEVAEFDVFISYRVWSDLKHATRLYEMLTAAGLRVWWDKKCLESGKEWQKGFCQGLGSSRAFLCILSGAGTDKPFESLKADSACDNVLLEHRLALELKQMDFVQFVFPLMIGDTVEEDVNQLSEYKFVKNTNKACVLSVEESLHHHLDELGLGTPLKHDLCVQDVVSGILACNGYFIGGRPMNTFENAVQGIVDTLTKKQPSVTSGVGDGDPMRSSKSVSILRSAVNDNRQQQLSGEATVLISTEEWDRVISERDTSMARLDSALIERNEAVSKADSAVLERDAALIERDELVRKLQAMEERLNAEV